MLVIKKYPRLGKKRGLMDSQLHMAGKASQSWWKTRRSKSRLTWMAEGRERTCSGKLHFSKPSDLVRLIHYHENSMGKTCPHDSITSSWAPSMGIMGTTIQDEMWAGTQSNHIILPLAPPKSHVLTFQNQWCLPNNCPKS